MFFFLRLLEILESDDTITLQQFLEDNNYLGDGRNGVDGSTFLLNNKLSSIYPITALDYAASMVSFFFFFFSFRYTSYLSLKIQ